MEENFVSIFESLSPMPLEEGFKDKLLKKLNKNRYSYESLMKQISKIVEREEYVYCATLARRGNDELQTYGDKVNRFANDGHQRAKSYIFDNVFRVQSHGSIADAAGMISHFYQKTEHQNGNWKDFTKGMILFSAHEFISTGGTIYPDKEKSKFKKIYIKILGY